MAYIWGFGFQMVIATTMFMLTYFTIQMLAFYIVFMDAAFLQRVSDFFRVRVGGRLKALARPDEASAPAPS